MALILSDSQGSMVSEDWCRVTRTMHPLEDSEPVSYACMWAVMEGEQVVPYTGDALDRFWDSFPSFWPATL